MSASTALQLLRDQGKIKVNDELLIYEGLPPAKSESKYEPCTKL